MPFPPERTDPVQIFARVAGPGPEPHRGGSKRAFQVWIHLAQEAGWEVSEDEYDASGSSGTACGSVLIERLRYVIHYGLRVRQTLVDVDPSTGRVRFSGIFTYAAWAEPDLNGYELP